MQSSRSKNKNISQTNNSEEENVFLVSNINYKIEKQKTNPINQNVNTKFEDNSNSHIITE